MSSLAVEARSLSSITHLASNPPAYPRNPTHVKHEPLVLYIARVPGSRDVFLSPMKPREKVVTAEDIQSSLYYIHVHHPEDVRLVAPPPPEQYYEDSLPPPVPPVPPVQRKAIPGHSFPPMASTPPRRKPVPSTLAPAVGVESRQNINAGTYVQASSGMLGPDHSPRRSFDSVQYRGENGHPLPPLPQASEQSYPEGTCLTLIRRDPASSAQWNVARIEDPPFPDISSSTLDDPGQKKRAGTPMYIDVNNPGYSKFLNNSARPPLPSRNSDQSDTLQGASDPRSSRSFEMQRNATEEVETSFRRRLWMEGARFSNGGFGHRKRNSHDASMGRQNPRSSFESYRGSADLRPPPTPPFLAREDQSYNTVQISDRQSNFRGYVFLSPWNGRCEFLTGAGGGSLRCRHVVPSLQGASPTAMPVSELRFNLPSGSKATTPREESSKRSSFFHRPRHNRNNSATSDVRSSVDEARTSLDRLDLSLGQEFAGGGFGGKQAKLGKLIIEDEGLKMLDLLVAANMALWWRAYEKVDTKSKGDRNSLQY